MRWFYLSDSQEQLPTSEDQIPSLVGAGVLRAQSLVWPDGAADWKTLGELRPELFTANTVSRTVLPSAPKATPAVAAHQLTRGLTQRYGWFVTSGGLLLILGVSLIVVAVLAASGLVHQWRQQTQNLEGSQISSGHYAWEIFRMILQVVLGCASAWLGLLVIQAAGRLRQGLLLGEPTNSEAGLQLLGKFFVLLTFSILITAIGSLLLWKFAHS